MATKKQPASRKDIIDAEEHKHRHQPVVSNSLRIKLEHLRTIEPLTQNQAKFFEAYKRGDYFIGCFGSAGTGKTTLPIYSAFGEVLSRDTPYKQVVVIRTSVQSGREIGFLPGSLDEKMEVFELPYKEISQMLFGRPDAWERLKEQGHARFITTIALRGISLDDSIIIFDEMQNANWQDVNTVMTRIGNRSKIIFCGDFRQNDLVHSRTDVSAFNDFLNVARRMQSFTEIYYTPDDIVRSSLTKDWIVQCEAANL